MSSVNTRPESEKPRFSFSETLLVLIAGMALLAGIYTLSNLLLRKNKVDQALSLLVEILQKADKGEETSEHLYTPWGGAIRVLLQGKQGRPFSVVMEGVPSLPCKHIAIQTKNFENGLTLFQIEDISFGPEQEEITPRTATFACTVLPEVKIRWDFDVLNESGK